MRRRSEEQRPYVHRGTTTRWRYELCVQTDCEVYAAEELVGRNFWHGNYRSRVLHASGVAGRTEDCDVARWCAEGFLSLVALLSCRAPSVQCQSSHESRLCSVCRDHSIDTLAAGFTVSLHVDLISLDPRGLTIVEPRCLLSLLSQIIVQ